MQMHFYVMPSSDMKEIKKDAFRDMGEKLQLWRHKLKRKLHIQMGDTPDIMKARARMILQQYNPEDMRKLLDYLCDVHTQVCQNFNCNNVLLVIVII
jgi:hypothetical protein